MTRFPYGSPMEVNLASTDNSLTHYTKGTQSPPEGLPLLVRARFQVLFHSPPGVLFTFPSRYWFAIGRQVVFSLGGWSPLPLQAFQTGFHVSGPTCVNFMPSVAYGGFTLCAALFQTLRLEDTKL